MNRKIEILAYTPMTKNSPSPRVEIVIAGNIETAGDSNLPLDEWRAIFDEQAQLLFEALRDSLPGGTIDRLTGKLLDYKACHFLVKG